MILVRPVQAQEATSTPVVAVVLPEAPNDIDGDGLLDAWETQIFHTDPNKADTDGDSFSDRTEILNSYNPLKKANKSVKWGDFDKDKLNDRLELLFGTDPMEVDTNHDGIADGQQVELAMSPTSTPSYSMTKSIKITLATQRMERQVDGISIDSNLISSGKISTPTPVGTYQVLNKSPRAWSKMAGLWMPYWMAFTTRGHGIHELPEWPSGYKEGRNHLGIPVSHGCIRLGEGVAKAVYDWTPIGTQVVVVRK